MLRLTAQLLRKQPKIIRRIFVAIIGGTVLLIGAAMLVLPGPAMLVIPAGLAILSLEFSWAARVLRKAKSLASKPLEAFKTRHHRHAGPS